MPPPYQPYVFENILSPPQFYPSIKTTEYTTNQPDDAYAQPVADSQNATNSDYNDEKDSTLPVQRLNKE